MKPTQAGRYKVTAPNGVEIRGTLERLSASADIHAVVITEDGGSEPEYTGWTEVYWDGQQTEEIGGNIVFVDMEGDEWLESKLVYTLMEG